MRATAATIGRTSTVAARQRWQCVRSEWRKVPLCDHRPVAGALVRLPASVAAAPATITVAAAALSLAVAAVAVAATAVALPASARLRIDVDRRSDALLSDRQP